MNEQQAQPPVEVPQQQAPQSQQVPPQAYPPPPPQGYQQQGQQYPPQPGYPPQQQYPPNYQQYPPYAPPPAVTYMVQTPPPPDPPRERKGMALTCMILGICSIPLMVVVGGGIVCAILSIIFGVVYKDGDIKTSKSNQKVKIGFTCSAVALGIVALVFIIGLFGAMVTLSSY